MDREEIFGKSPEGTILWCMHCERTYEAGKYRMIVMSGEAYEMCPYEGCEGDAVLNAHEWDWVRSCNPQYPATPNHGEVYPLYP